jgi:DNA-binding NtrC family response regulator
MKRTSVSADAQPRAGPNPSNHPVVNPANDVDRFQITSRRTKLSIEMLMLKAPPGDITVLLLEREPGLREIMIEGLTRSGFQVICALTAKHAAWICRDHGGLIDLLLSDVTALGERPLDCLQTIKGVNSHLPVLLISAYDRHSLSEMFGALLTSHEFLPKPFLFSHLTKAIQTLLQLQTTPAEPHPGGPQANGE